ncbi:MAG: hypothetical protein KDE50_07885, partial [Caldilineaceae bacterium]|nr:hypothetical protein [Caldilineaceae bacterium]
MHTDSASSPIRYFNPLHYQHDGGARRWLMLALVLLLATIISSGAFGRAQAQVTEPVPADQAHDLGDAPDNT